MDSEVLKEMLDQKRKELAEFVEAANKEMAYRKGQVDLLEKLVEEGEGKQE
jgi:CHASE3 domain sensor protein